ncbi:hypothetical protein H5410_046500 [Solanum commersonii]|uniref:Uncharacterized protein n=1 Tax=Solanum commersonii TaxID=4109 RepID=A0A9J5XEF3_SOLCO|nr:hypothetical protein H5410_046500 [Solanum commersonii]
MPPYFTKRGKSITPSASIYHLRDQATDVKQSSSEYNPDVGEDSPRVPWNIKDVSYSVVTVKYLMPKKGKELAQPPLLSTWIREVSIDILEHTIRLYLHGPNYEQTTSTTKCEYKIQLVTDTKAMNDFSQKEDLLRWVACYIAKHGVDAD